MFTQYTLDDYLFRLSCARIQFMAMDNTHTKYLKGKDKKVWESYKEAYESQKKLDNFMDSLKVPELKAGEEYEIPLPSKKGGGAQ